MKFELLPGMPQNIFNERYTFTDDETWEQACMRLAVQMAKAESPEKYQKYVDKFFEVLVNNFFMPGGRIWYSSGRPDPQLLNCFVLRSEIDSKEGWADLVHDNIITSMSGGGCGQDFSDIRPNGAEIRGHRGICPGPIELMKGVNSVAKMVRAGGGRRAANMFSLNLRHPDIESFLDSKTKVDEIEMANISVNSGDTKKFIEAVKTDSDWELNWKGRYKKTVKAKKLWDSIVQNAYNVAEPGVLNLELANSENTIYYLEDLTTTNPCGELFLTPNESCCLGHLVLPRFIKNSTSINWEQLGQTIRLAVRFLDNVLDMNSFPLPEMKERAQKYRRVGLGVTGLADMLALLNLRYGSKEGNDFLDKLFRFISKQAYEASVMLAVEKGMFPACKPDLHIKSGYVKRMTPKVKSLIEEHGIRNCALLTIAPTGTVSIVCNNCSSGIEPMFAPAYRRFYYKGDRKESEIIFHPLFAKFLAEKRDVSHFVGSKDLSAKDHFEVQKVVQKHIDNAVSKTINLPKDYSIQEMSDLWLDYLPFVKGATFYREGSHENAPLQALDLEEAKKLFEANNKIKTGTKEHKCKSGKCDL